MSGTKVPLVYEIIDVQPAFLDQGWKGRILRFLERLVLRFARALVVSSPGFMSHYFKPIQHFQGRWFLIENKLRRSDPRFPDKRSAVSAKVPIRSGPPWVIGYFGVFRCQRSLQILGSLTSQSSGLVQVLLRGYPTAVSETDFDAMLRQNKRLSYGGSYSYPEDLAQLHPLIHIAWCFDFSVAGGNSAWLLPNRLYAAGAHCTPVIALKGTETGAFVERYGIGWTFPEPVDSRLAEFFANLSEYEYRRCVDRLAELSSEIFVEDKDVKIVSDYLESLQ
jgi:succinoglycan biosynthesis protein ExoL